MQSFNCPRCKMAHTPTARFCQQCGLQFTIQTITGQTEAASPQVLEKSQADKDKDLGYKVMGYGLLGICLIVIVSILGSVKNKSDSMQKASSSALITTPAPETPSTPTPIISNAEKLSKAKAAMKTGTQYKTAESLLPQIPESDPAYKEAKPLLEQAGRKIAEMEGPRLREQLRNSYEELMRKANPHLYVVADREQADFEIKGTAEMKKAGWAKTIFGTGRPAVNASIQIINIRTSIVAYSVASHKDNAWSGYKSAAEHIAKNVANED